MSKSNSSIGLASLFVAVIVGCQQQEEFPEMMGFKMPEAVKLTECEGPGFRYGIPPGWVSEVAGSTVTAKPNTSAGTTVVKLHLSAYKPGETAELAVDAAFDARGNMKTSKEHIKLMTAGFPSFRQLYRKDGKKNGKPDRVYHLIATPIGKITVESEFKDGIDLVKYYVDTDLIAGSVKF